MEQPRPATTASMFTDNGCPSLTISCCAASAPQRPPWGRCSSFSGGCSTHGPKEFEMGKKRTTKKPNYNPCQRLSTNSKYLHATSYLWPVVTGSVCEDVAVVVEAAGSDWLVQLLRGLQLGAGVFVPEAEASVWAHSGQRAVDGMEGNGVHLKG